MEQALPKETRQGFDWKQSLRDFYDLSKPGIGFYSVITTAASYWLATIGAMDWPLFIHTIIATTLVTMGGGALNQVIEVEQDAVMRRTENRPLPSGRVPVVFGLAFGVAASIAGTAYLLFAVNGLSALLALATLVGYLFVYTPLKRVTHLSTLVGAFPGAIPILIGWVAVRNALGIEAWTLFAILFLWQIPHFLAIAWMYRHDYERAGFPMLTVIDEGGQRAAFQILVYTLPLVPLGLLPTLLHLTGLVYFVGSLLLGIGFSISAIRTATLRTNRAAKELLIASIIYLPLLLLFMVIDKA